jgi:hypothetical protein
MRGSESMRPWRFHTARNLIPGEPLEKMQAFGHWKVRPDITFPSKSSRVTLRWDIIGDFVGILVESVAVLQVRVSF